MTFPLVFAAALAMAGCSLQNPVDPAATTTTTSATPDTPPGPLASVDPCSLLSPDQQHQHGMTQDDAGQQAGVRFCQWQKPSTNSSSDPANPNGFEVVVNIYDHNGLNDFNKAGLTIAPHDPVDQHQAELIKDTKVHDCIIGIATSDTSRIEIGADPNSGDTDHACSLAEQELPLILDNLPGGW